MRAEACGAVWPGPLRGLESLWGRMLRAGNAAPREMLRVGPGTFVLKPRAGVADPPKQLPGARTAVLGRLSAASAAFVFCPVAAGPARLPGRRVSVSGWTCRDSEPEKVRPEAVRGVPAARAVSPGKGGGASPYPVPSAPPGLPPLGQPCLFLLVGPGQAPFPVFVFSPLVPCSCAGDDSQRRGRSSPAPPGRTDVCLWLYRL